MDEIIIPEFTREDYISGSKPYEWLSQFAANKFQLQQLIIRVDEDAKSKKVNCFKKMFKLYMDSQQKADFDVGLNVTEFEGQELQLDCGKWQCDDFGVTGHDKYGFEIIACTHPIMPVQRLMNIDSGTEKVKIAYKKGSQWRSIIVDKKTLASNNSIVSVSDFGIAVTSENSRHLVRYLSEIESMNYEKIPELNSVGRLGWIPGYGFSPYVENLVFDGEAQFKHFFESVKEHGSFKKWLEVADKVRRGNSIPARVVLASSFASALVEPCGALPFFVHLWGNTEGGKTVALMLAASVWANPRMGEYIHTFNSTGVGQELSAVFVNSMPLILDELQIIKDKKDFDQMIYQLTEGVGRQRGAKTGGLQKVGTWNNCIITSGEMPISVGSSGGGATNRIIDVEYSEALFSDPVFVAETVKKHYGFAGKKFIEAVSDETVMGEVLEKQKEFLHELQKSESTDKQAMSASLILTADFFAERFIFQDGIKLTAEDIKPFLSTKTDVSQNLRAYEYILDILTMNESKFLPDAKEGSEVWGVRDESYMYVLVTKFKQLVADGGYNPTALLSWMKKNRLIDYEKGRTDKVKKIGKLSRRCVWVSLKNITDIMDYFTFDGITDSPFSD